MNDFASLIRSRRKELGIPLRVLAERTRLSIPYLSELERGKKPPPSTNHCLTIAGGLELNPQELLTAAAHSKTTFVLTFPDYEVNRRGLAASLASGEIDEIRAQFLLSQL